MLCKVASPPKITVTFDGLMAVIMKNITLCDVRKVF
jgi:hypothetical protein